jgi:hypothetical protein
MPTVYVVQEDPDKNFEPALVHAAGGQLRFIFGAKYRALLNPQGTLATVRAVLQGSRPEDFMLCNGDPVAQAYVFGELFRRNGGVVKLLKWVGGAYVPVEVDFNRYV